MVELQSALPLAAPLAQMPGWPSLKMPLRRAFALGLASLILSTGVYFSSDQTGTGAGIFMLLALVVFLASLFTPWVVAVVATTSTAHALQTDEYRPISLSTASNIEIVRGYVLAALYRVRILVMLVIGLMPLVVLGVAYSGLFVGATFIGFEGSTRPSLSNWTGSTLWLMALMIGLWGMSLLAAALGVWLALWVRHSSSEVEGLLPKQPGCIVSALPLLLTIVIMILCWLLLNQVILLYALVPYLLGIGFISLAQRWARRRPAVVA